MQHGWNGSEPLPDEIIDMTEKTKSTIDLVPVGPLLGLPKSKSLCQEGKIAVKSEGMKIFVISFPNTHDLNMGTTSCKTIISNNFSPYRLKPQYDALLNSLPALSRCVIVCVPVFNPFRLMINDALVPIAVHGDIKSLDESDSDLDYNYLNHLQNLVNAGGSIHTLPPKISLSSLTMSANAPKTLYTSTKSTIGDMQNLGLDQLFQEEEDNDETAPFHVLNVSTESGVIVRQYKNTWKASTPDGKLLRGGRGKFPLSKS